MKPVLRWMVDGKVAGEVMYETKFKIFFAIKTVLSDISYLGWSVETLGYCDSTYLHL